eukprot:358544-Chlamydomonas_euryale.AAC.2
MNVGGPPFSHSLARHPGRPRRARAQLRDRSTVAAVGDRLGSLQVVQQPLAEAHRRARDCERVCCRHRRVCKRAAPAR